MKCQICGGRLQGGEPAIAYNDGLAHRFSTTCDWFKRKFAELDLDSETKPWEQKPENADK